MPLNKPPHLEGPMREIGVYHLQNGIKNLLFCDNSPSKTALYYAEINMITKNVPDVKLYSLPSTISATLTPEVRGTPDGTKTTGEQARGFGTMAGAAWFRHAQQYWTRPLRLCLGDPEKVRGVVWARMKDVRRSHGEYVISVPDEAEGAFETGFATGFDGGWEGSGEGRGTAEAVPEAKRRTFRWLRTHSKASGLENGYLSRKWSMANLKLVDETGRLIVVFESNGVKSFRKQGKLKIYRGGVEEAGASDANIAQGQVPALELMIVLSFCVVEEKFRRGV